MLIADVTQSKASPKYEKCTFADTGRLNSTLDIPGPARKRLAVQKFHVMWKHHGLFGANFHRFTYVLPYGWSGSSSFAGTAGSFLRRIQIYSQDASILGWTCGNLIAPAGSAAVSQLFTTCLLPYLVTDPLKCHPNGFFTKDSVYNIYYIYIYVYNIIYHIFMFYLQIHIFIYIMHTLRVILEGKQLGRC